MLAASVPGLAAGCFGAGAPDWLEVSGAVAGIALHAANKSDARIYTIFLKGTIFASVPKIHRQKAGGSHFFKNSCEGLVLRDSRRIKPSQGSLSL
jgi:hypothetical protein